MLGVALVEAVGRITIDGADPVDPADDPSVLVAGGTIFVSETTTVVTEFVSVLELVLEPVGCIGLIILSNKFPVVPAPFEEVPALVVPWPSPSDRDRPKVVEKDVDS